MIANFVVNNRKKAIVASTIFSHGLTDIDVDFFAASYAMMFFLPSRHVNILFGFLSLLHFEADTNMPISLFLHFLAVGSTLVSNKSLGLDVISMYMQCVHLPLHYNRHFNDHGVSCGNVLAILSTVVASVTLPFPSKIKITNLIKK